MNKKISDSICILEDGGLQMDNEIWTVFECNMCKKVKNNMLKFMFADQGAKGKLKLLQSKIICINHLTISISLLLSNPFPALFHKA